MENVNLKLKGIRADELSFKLNGVRPGSGKVEMAPSFSRRVRRAAENEKAFFVTLSVKIESTAEKPKPIDLSVTMTGVFEVDTSDESSVRSAVVGATSVLYPYLRSAVTSLSTTAMTAPIVLPVVSGVLFPEDAEPQDEKIS